MNRLAVRTFTSMADLGFDPMLYSRLKYGCMYSSIILGIELGIEIGKWVESSVKEGEIVMLAGAPYNKVPVASTALAIYATMYLQDKYPNITFKAFKINRDHSYDVDYGSMSASEREELISAEKFTCNPADLEGQHTIFIDDIVISGAHERNMVRMVEDLQLESNIVYAYYAMLSDESCCPTIENDLNHSWIEKDGSNIVDFIAECCSQEQNYPTGIILNTRCCKFLLSLNYEIFGTLISDNFIPAFFYIELYRLALANGYHKVELYQKNFTTLKNLIDITNGFS